MGKKKDKKQKKTPVPTGGDFRAVVRSAAADARESGASAPDGVSGDWR
jgi:hypothetical protein